MADIATLGIRVTSEGVKQAERDLKALEDQGAQTERRAIRMGKAIGIALGGAVVAGVGLAAAGMRTYIANTIEAERVQAQLAARIKSTGGAAGLVLDDLNKMADALQQATTFDDESINSAQALLLTFTRIGKDVFPQATEAVLNMSTALGTDLNSAALQVGKALNDPVLGVTALSRAGVQFSEAQKDTIKRLVETGEVAKAQAIVLRELETQMGGAARAARDTLGGAIQALKNSFDNLLEGDSGSEGVRGTRDAIESFNRTLNDPGIKRGVDSAASGILSIANAAVQLIAKLGDAGAALSEFFAANERKSRASLQNILNDKETELFAVERNNSRSLPFLRRDTTPLKEEIAELERLISARDRSARSAQNEAKAAAAWQRAQGILRPGVQAPEVSEDPDKPKRRRSGRSAMSEEARAAQQLQETYLSLLAQRRENIALMGVESEEVRTRYATEFGELRNLSEAKKEELILAAREEDAKRSLLIELERETELRKQEAEAIAEGQRRTDDLIENMQFELELMGMSNLERAKAIALRQADANATDAQRAAVADLAVELERAREVEDFKDDLKGLFVDLADGVGSAKDAIDNFFDRLKQRALEALADKAIEALFNMGKGGGQGGGASGGGDFWGNLIGAIGSYFGGGRAIGGPVSKGRIYEVGEKGIETFHMNGRQYLIPPASGQVTPVEAGSGGGPVSQVFNTVIQGRMDRSTEEQFHRRQGREAALGLSRTGR